MCPLIKGTPAAEIVSKQVREYQGTGLFQPKPAPFPLKTAQTAYMMGYKRYGFVRYGSLCVHTQGFA